MTPKKLIQTLCVLFCALLRPTAALICSCPALNERPIVGVLSQEYFGKLKGSGHYSYIAASYVKYLESGGARVVPILIDQEDEYYERLFGQINGVLFPGGGQDLVDSGYGKAGKKLYELALAANAEGDYFPLWGTCLGFELLTVLAANGSWLTTCNSTDQDLPLEFLLNDQQLKDTKMFHEMRPYLLEILREKSVTINYHRKCINETNWAASGLDKDYTIISKNADEDGLVFISTFESKVHPFYGVQWHPEKNQFEFVLKDNRINTPHDYEAIIAAQYFANFFVNEARKSDHCFENALLEREALIYNYSPEYTGLNKSDFEQIYFFSSSAPVKPKMSLLTLLSMTLGFQIGSKH